MSKVTVTENFYTANENSTTKMPAFLRYTEIIPKTILVKTRSSGWNVEDIINHETGRRFAIAINTSQLFVAGQLMNPIHFQNFDLSSATVSPNGYPLDGTWLATEIDKKITLVLQKH